VRESVLLEIDTDALRNNLREVRRVVGPAARIAAVVKADAYGLGAVVCGREFLDAGASLLAVARLEEALELRRALPGAPVLVMGHTEDGNLRVAVDRDIAVTIFEERQAELLSAAASARRGRAVAHVKIDTGMNRLGLRCADGADAAECARRVARMAALPALKIEGLYTHLALVDGPSDALQFARFRAVADALAGLGIDIPLKHVCDSIGLVRYPEYRLDLVRAGAILYGMAPTRLPPGVGLKLRFAASLRARVSRVVRLAPGEGVGYDFTYRAGPGGATLATVAAGYADGYPRCLSNRGFVSIRGKRAPVVGLVCMDQLTVDASGIDGVVPGDEAALLGDGIDIMELAELAGTNRNEILSSLGRRIPRSYLNGGAEIARADYLAAEGGIEWKA
jgi:alanine racemase